MTIHLHHAGLIMEVGLLPGTLIASIFETSNQVIAAGIELKAVGGTDGIQPATTLDFTETLSEIKRRGKTDLQLMVNLQANKGGGHYAFLLRYPGGQHPETGRLRPGQSKAWTFSLLM